MVGVLAAGPPRFPRRLGMEQHRRLRLSVDHLRPTEVAPLAADATPRVRPARHGAAGLGETGGGYVLYGGSIGYGGMGVPAMALQQAHVRTRAVMVQLVFIEAGTSDGVARLFIACCDSDTADCLYLLLVLRLLAISLSAITAPDRQQVLR